MLLLLVSGGGGSGHNVCYYDLFFFLIPLVSPVGSVIVDSMQQTVNNGSSISFTCSADGGPGNTFQWMREGNSVTLSSGGDVDISTNSTHSVLTISNVNATEHGGGYRCVVSNAAGNDSDNGTLFVSPVITVQPVETLLTSNGSIEQLVCEAESFPAPDYRWERLEDSAVTTVGNSNVLSFSPVVFSDFGQYRCVATAPVINAVVYSNNATVIGESMNGV